MERLVFEKTKLPKELIKHIILPLAWDTHVSESIWESFRRHILPQMMLHYCLYHPSMALWENDLHPSIGNLWYEHRDQHYPYFEQQFFIRHSLSDHVRHRSRYVQIGGPRIYLLVNRTESERRWMEIRCRD